MSITVQNLTKTYGTQRAIDSLTFTINKGEIVGFLGPNGAGKSTTMKIITGFLSATEGSVEVEGLNVTEQPIEVKKRIGYLPEHNPLYVDMYVREYLDLMCSLYGIERKKLKSRVAEIIELVGLSAEQHKKIGQL
ncbi:MAG: ATP-binding cassette domain-containing protein, partial [Spirosomaceae bacterium]|nr:ATP-binding cassette domain-containing protein [Spirosomataceae bacterium]